MVAYNFRAEYAEKVRTRAKRRTIRAYGKRRHARPGDMLQLYTGMRTKRCEKLLEVPCRSTSHVAMLPDKVVVVPISQQRDGQIVYIVRRGELDEFAHLDGLENWMSMRELFEQMHGWPFGGLMIQW